LRYRVELVRVTAVCALALGGAFALWACGPFFPNWLLASDAYVLDAPTVWFAREVEPFLPKGQPKQKAAPVDDPYLQTKQVAIEDLRAALDKSGTPAARREELLGQYEALRDGVVSWGAALAGWREEAAWSDSPPPRPAFSPMTVPAGLPGEFADYEKGAMAFHAERMDEARAAWERLLARPAGERRFRTTWAAFMLGRSQVESDPAAAAKWFAKTRELAAEGFADPLGLAAASLGWEARAEMARGRHDAALKLYGEQTRTGDPRAVESLRRAARSALKNPEAARRVARSPEARPVVTAYVLSDWTRVDYDGPLDPEKARTWLAAVKAENLTKVEHADQLAWAAYRAGDFAAADEWLKRAAADAPMARWIRAKLLMRDGQLAEAEALLVEAAPALAENPMGDEEPWLAYESGVQPAGRPRALGELGVVRLARKEYAPALDALARGGYWTDAAYVAERVLTVEELKAYVDKEWPRSLMKTVDDESVDEGWNLVFAGLASPETEDVSWRIRDLLGRRLVRAGRYAQAVPYLEGNGPAVEELAAALQAGKDAARPAGERAESLFEAACATRHYGLEIQGTELEPDWALQGGSYDVGSFVESRSNPETHARLGPTDDEKKRVEKSRAEPFQRFHYRFRAADLAWEAASLLPDGSPEKARMLAVGGTWIKNRDAKAADRFYRALVSCCGQTDLGREAARVKWFPAVEDCAPPAPEGEEEP
jgi:tetratricopeptide (TPR) repeat protein